MSDPRTEYQRRLEQRQGRLAALQRREDAISNCRLVVFLAGVALTVLVLATDRIHPLWLLAPLALFVVIVVYHDVVIRRRDRAAGAVKYYEQGIARLEGRWAGTGIQRTEGLFAEDHPYAADLDLFGAASLFELLCTARTRAGEETLARWLLAPAAVEQIRLRQQAVAQMRELVDLREDLALLGGGMRAEIDPEALSRWGEAPPPLPGARAALLRWTAVGLAAAAVAAGLLWGLLDLGPLPLLAVAAVQWVVYRLVGARIKSIVGAVDRAQRELWVLGLVLARIEREQLRSSRPSGAARACRSSRPFRGAPGGGGTPSRPFRGAPGRGGGVWDEAAQFRAPLLRELHSLLTDGSRTASASIRRLDRLVVWLDAQRNALFAPVGFLLMWPVHFALAIEAWRLRTGGNIRRWLGAVGQIEALGALAAYSFEHPADPFPELAEQGPLLRAEQLGHPLIAEDASVRNDVELGDGVRTWIVSGSNMSGKTTLLRTVGINTVLALAGAPVRASSLKLSVLALGATIRIHDSLQARRSRFYAEIQRLKQLMDLADGPAPLLFLLDEILHGTNSHDRLVGATALIHQFLARGAIGLITTHDLAIADAGSELEGRVDNRHFRDHLHQGQLAFDYKVRPGVVQGSNAIALMRAVGLDICGPDSPPQECTDGEGLKKITSSS